ncbi:PREDICTED: uncharacterized protein LOC105560320 isoform X3 [Vollenhovia emeryi]|nr:PREDICTED: uncharacterized protein LOC105560320 isoform X3 [Vollenhovia emeryi]
MDDEAQEDEELLDPAPVTLTLGSQVLDATSMSSLAHLNNFMNHPLLAKYRMERGEELMQGRGSGLEAIQAAINNNMSLFQPHMYMPQVPPQPSHLPQSSANQLQVAGGNLGAQLIDNQVMASRTGAIAQPNESSPPRCRNNGESSQGNSKNNGESPQGSSRNNGEAREGEARAASANNQHPSGANWSFEEQFRQLYELDESVERKAFLDELFSFMQSRGTPISRLPIMAKSVLDLYELYKLVVHRGGLVEVINKKLWQEIIKGLKLPASITSAAFTLRTQYMKYLYPYEREKEALSTQEQLQTAIETNRRESRRNHYTYTNNENAVVGTRSHVNTMSQNPIPLPLTMAQMAAVAANESQHHVANGHLHAPQHHLPPNMPTSSQLSEYMMRIMRDRGTISNNSMLQGNTSTPPPVMPEGYKAGLQFWSTVYNPGNNNMYPTGLTQPPYSPSSSHSPIAAVNSPEPQREALDLANSGHSSSIRLDSVSSPTNTSVNSPPGAEMKRSAETAEFTPSTSSKRMIVSDDVGSLNIPSLRISQQVNTRENGRKELEISINIDGTLYEGVLPAKPTKRDDSSTPSSPNNDEKGTQDNES